MEGVIAANLVAVRGRIEAAARAPGRTSDSVNLVAVSKTHPAASVHEALVAGHRVFGENRVQEAQAKYPALREAFPDLSLHLIGPLQTNKVRDAVALCHVIETVDRPRLAQLDTVVAFTLAREAGGTRVRLVHSAFVLPRNERAYRNMGEGWKRKVHDLLTIATEGQQSDADS